jgi:chromosome segregation ATPase
MQEVSELQRQVDELSERLEIIGRERDELRRASGELRDRVDHESRERELSERALTEARDELAHARDQLATVTERQADAEGQLARTRETLEHLQAQEQAWNQHRAELEQSLQTERERHAQQTDENAATWAQKERETREAHARVQAELDAAQTDLSTLREAVESARAEANETRAQHAESERARADMQRRLDEADALRSREQAEWKAQFEHEQAANRARCEELESRLQDSKAHATTLLENARGEWQARELDLQNQLIAVQGELAGARERIDGLSAELERMAENRVSAAAESDQRIARLRSDVETAARLQRSAEEREQAALRRCEALQAHIIKLEIELAAAHDTVFEGSQANANQQVAQLSTQLDAVTRKYQALRGQLRSMGINIG